MTLREHDFAPSSCSDAPKGLTRCWAWLMAAALLLAACVIGSPRMRPVRAPEPLRPAEGYAMVVFVQPSDLAVEQPLTLLDGQGRFLGDSLGQTYFSVQVPPGEHLWVGRADGVTALRATVQAGQTTYVHVVARPRSVGPAAEATEASGPVHYQLLLLAPADSQWAQLTQWLVECTQLVADERAGQAYLRAQGDQVAEWIQQGEQLAGPSASAPRSAQNSPSQ